jgi:putative hemolysin
MADDQNLSDLQEQLRRLRLQTNAVIERIDQVERNLQAQRQQRLNLPVFEPGQRVRIRNPRRYTAPDSFGTVTRLTNHFVVINTDRGDQIKRKPFNLDHV